MENINQTPELQKTPEVIKQEAFADIMRSVLFRFNQERVTVSNFDFEGKKYPVDTLAAGVKAFGQIPSSMAKVIYQEVLSHQ